MSASQTLLTVEDVEVIYGQSILALHGISIQVDAGSIVALLGSNGAGKTTTLKAISNLLASERGRVSRGAIMWKGESTKALDPSSVVEKGIVQVLEGRHVFSQLTVEENLLTGSFLRKLSRPQTADELERIYAWFPRLKEKRRVKAGLASGGEQQMVAIGRALMTRPTLVLLDEPSMGLAPIIVQEIFEIVKSLNEKENVSFLLAEQNIAMALKCATHAYVLETGRVVRSGPAAELLASDDLTDLYFGGAKTLGDDVPAAQ
ncbi:ABC transporter ATP-binding protein [Hoeflea sp. Naph1]|uniref:ABC transporter ATP-binding protein n=1 Tax=Hoeflea sp. Naph1 TaxID=3388653 RepID=UPI00398FED69